MDSDHIKKLKNFLEKVVINAGVGRLSQAPNFSPENGGGILAQVTRDIGLLTGQRPQVCRARKSIAGFKIREGQIVGVRVTLRDQKMIDFWDRLIRIVLPRVHDFRGLSEGSVDNQGVLNIGIREQLVFPEVNAEESPVIFPLGVNVVPRIKSKNHAVAAYKDLGVPFGEISARGGSAYGEKNVKSKKTKSKK